MADLRETIAAAMKDALKAKDQTALATMRLISAALKDRDIAARGSGNQDGITDEEILSMMQTMIKQRNESAKMYRDGNRPELADAEEAEIGIIPGFLPAQLGEAEITASVCARPRKYFDKKASRELSTPPEKATSAPGHSLNQSRSLFKSLISRKLASNFTTVNLD